MPLVLFSSRASKLSLGKDLETMPESVTEVSQVQERLCLKDSWTWTSKGGGDRGKVFALR